jgi:hypothetical protein
MRARERRGGGRPQRQSSEWTLGLANVTQCHQKRPRGLAQVSPRLRRMPAVERLPARAGCECRRAGSSSCPRSVCPGLGHALVRVGGLPGEREHLRGRGLQSVSGAARAVGSSHCSPWAISHSVVNNDQEGTMTLTIELDRDVPDRTKDILAALPTADAPIASSSQLVRDPPTTVTLA